MYFEHNKKYSFVKIIGQDGSQFVSTIGFAPGRHRPLRIEIVELTSTSETLVPRVGQLNKTSPGFVFIDCEGGEWFHLSLDTEAVQGTIYEAAVRNHVTVIHEDSDRLGKIHLVELEAYLQYIKTSAYPGIDDTTVGNNLREFHYQLLALAGRPAP